ATIRHIILNLLQRTKTAKKKSLHVKRGLTALDETFLQTVLMAARPVQTIPLLTVRPHQDFRSKTSKIANHAFNRRSVGTDHRLTRCSHQ
ncbi:MAG TPA: hypothetical protein VHW90_08835, partial [Stellaceae bacterium]|nr:hypothetical protein [Stellaceae bacterium]